MSKKAVIAVAFFVLAAIVVPGVSAQEPFARFASSANTEAALERFPENLRSGFYGLSAALAAMGQPEERVVEVLDGFLAINFVRVNVIEAGLQSVPFPNQSVTYAEFYAAHRATLMATLIHSLPAVIVMGNPGGTNWDLWFAAIEAFL
ncbi:MAG: hypothetical protein FWG66_10330 [Spirochaetes bacterium]|nr:hypothetical protein [Spirochaetota bacterium]